jgi:hypothetical protein
MPIFIKTEGQRLIPNLDFLSLLAKHVPPYFLEKWYIDLAKILIFWAYAKEYESFRMFLALRTRKLTTIY